MKKINSIILISCLLFAILGCTNNSMSLIKGTKLVTNTEDIYSYEIDSINILSELIFVRVYVYKNNEFYDYFSVDYDNPKTELSKEFIQEIKNTLENRILLELKNTMAEEQILKELK